MSRVSRALSRHLLQKGSYSHCPPQATRSTSSLRSISGVRGDSSLTSNDAIRTGLFDSHSSPPDHDLLTHATRSTSSLQSISGVRDDPLATANDAIQTGSHPDHDLLTHAHEKKYQCLSCGDRLSDAVTLAHHLATMPKNHDSFQQCVDFFLLFSFQLITLQRLCQILHLSIFRIFYLRYFVREK